MVFMIYCFLGQNYHILTPSLPRAAIAALWLIPIGTPIAEGKFSFQNLKEFFRYSN